MTFEQFVEANSLYNELKTLQRCRKCCQGLMEGMKELPLTPSVSIPFDITHAIMAKAVELLTERIEEKEKKISKL